MKITDELFERGKNQKEICTVIDDDYVLIKKTMPCTDQEFPKYFENLRKAKESGINVCTIVDYRFIEDKKSVFNSGGKEVSYTTGVFIEERAKGSSNPEHKKPIKDCDSLREYINTCEEYITDLEKRASADQNIFDKLVSDYVGLFKFGLNPDPKPTNFFFDEKEGFTIIDVIDVENKSNEYLSRYLLGAVFGYGIPVSYSLGDTSGVLTESWYERYNKASEEIFKKVITSIKKLGLEDEYTKKDLEYTQKVYEYKQLIIPDNELETYINNYGTQR